MTRLSFFNFLVQNKNVLKIFEQAIEIIFGPNGKIGLKDTKSKEVSFLDTGYNLLNNITFTNKQDNILKKIIEQAANNTFSMSGDGSSLTILLICEILNVSYKFINSGYNQIFISKGLIKISSFLLSKLYCSATIILTKNELINFYETFSQKILFPFPIEKYLKLFSKNQLVLLEETHEKNYVFEKINGIELDKGFISSYFVNDLKNFEVMYEHSRILILNSSLNSFIQIKDLVNNCVENGQALIIIVENIDKQLLKHLILLKIQKQAKICIIKYNSINFLKNGTLQDLAFLTQSQYSLIEKEMYTFEDLGYVEKVIISKEKSTFLTSQFRKSLVQRYISDLKYKASKAETEYEKNLFQIRIARLSGTIFKIKIPKFGIKNFEDERKKIERILLIFKSLLQEGSQVGGGQIFIIIKKELQQWGYMNLLGDEILASNIILQALNKPLKILCLNANVPFFSINEKLEKRNFQDVYNFVTKKFESNKIIDSSKAVRLSVWNSISICSSILTSE